MASSEETVAVLGAGGTMGRGMAANMLRAGLGVRAWNHSPEKAEPLGEQGATVVDSLAEAAQGASIVVTILTDADVVMDVMGRSDGFLSGVTEKELVWAQMSTIGVSGTERCAELAERHGIIFLDAPVLGTKGPAEQGELVVLASGPEAAGERIDPVFAAIGSRTMWLGPAGAASRLKLIINSWIVTLAEGAAETIALAEGAGVDPHQFLEAISGSPLDLPFLRIKAKAMIERDFEPSLRLALAAKDASLAVELAELHDLDLPLIKTIAERMAEGVAEHGDEDLAATFLTSAPRDPSRSQTTR